MNKNIFLLIITLGLKALCIAQPTDIQSPNIFSEIDVARHNEAIDVLLRSQDEQLKQQTIDSILKKPNDYNPTVIYALSNILFTQDRKDDAVYWFYIAQLRARYDANLCLEVSARQIVSALNAGYGPTINQYAFNDIDKLHKIVIKVVEFVRTNEENYDHRWVNLHGMAAVLAKTGGTSQKTELSEPKEKWAEIKKQTIDNYYNDFIKYALNRN